MPRTSKNSREYWRDREIEHARSVLKDDYTVVDRIEGYYRDAAREIEKEIGAALTNYASRSGLSMEDVIKLANETDIRDFERKAARYVREKNFSPRANREMAIYNFKMRLSRMELLLMYIDLELIALSDGVEGLVYERLIEVGMEELRRQAGILGESLQMDRTGIDYIARRQFHGDDFSNRIWKNKRALHAELEQRLSEAVISGQSPIEVARKLRQNVESNVFNSERLLITETARVQSQVQIESFKDMGIDQYEFIATEGACDVCKPLDGKVFYVIEAMPGENMAPVHPFCRCSVAAYVDREAWDANLRSRGL